MCALSRGRLGAARSPRSRRARPTGSAATSTVDARRRPVADVPRVDLVHRRRSRRGRRGRPSSSRAGRGRCPASSRIAPQVRDDLLGLLLDRAADHLRVAGLERRAGRRRTRARRRLIACEYGAPWNGAGAASVRTTVLLMPSSLLSAVGRHALRQRDAERLEDRLEHVLRVVALDQADVQRQPGALGELVAGSARRDRLRARRRAPRRDRRSRRRAAGPRPRARRARAPRPPAATAEP